MSDLRLEKGSSINIPEYNNLIGNLVEENKAFLKEIQVVLKYVSSTVMVKDMWTDESASNYAYWFMNSKERNDDGADYLGRAIKNSDKIVRLICFEPIKAVVKRATSKDGSDPLAHHWIKKMHQSKDVWEAMDSVKYRKKDFPDVNFKRADDWAVVTNPMAVNIMLDRVAKAITSAETHAKNMQKYAKNSLDSVIKIDGVNFSDIKSIVDEMINDLNYFQGNNDRLIREAIGSEAETRTEIETKTSGSAAADE